jgi:hypothetical protein
MIDYLLVVKADLLVVLYWNYTGTRDGYGGLACRYAFIVLKS